MITAKRARDKAQNESIVFHHLINLISNAIEEKSSYGEFSISFGLNNPIQMRLKSKIVTHLEYHGYSVVDRDERLIIEW